FFFSSRRRHTRFSRDWSSDVCSSDLRIRPPPTATSAALATGAPSSGSPSSPPPAAGGGGGGASWLDWLDAWQPASAPATPVAPAASIARRDTRIGPSRIVISREVC